MVLKDIEINLSIRVPDKYCAAKKYIKKIDTVRTNKKIFTWWSLIVAKGDFKLV